MQDLTLYLLAPLHSRGPPASRERFAHTMAGGGAEKHGGFPVPIQPCFSRHRTESRISRKFEMVDL